MIEHSPEPTGETMQPAYSRTVISTVPVYSQTQAGQTLDHSDAPPPASVAQQARCLSDKLTELTDKVDRILLALRREPIAAYVGDPPMKAAEPPDATVLAVLDRCGMAVEMLHFRVNTVAELIGG
jgi:hypothetical protein